MSVHRIRDGILIDRASALELADALEQLGRYSLREKTQRRAELRYALRSSAAEMDGGSCADLASLAQTQVAQWFTGEDVPSSVHEYEFTTADAAALLDCTEANVRDLLARGVLTGSKRGGRWLLHSGPVLSRANRST